MVYQEVTSDSGTFKLEATEYSPSTSASDFEAPYETTDLGDLSG
jgi:hypothetical protein